MPEDSRPSARQPRRLSRLRPTGRTTDRRLFTTSAGLAAVVSLLASLLTLTGAAPATAAPAADCAPLALAPFGDPGDAVGKADIPADGSACFTVTVPAAGLYKASLYNAPDAYIELTAADGTPVDCHDEQTRENGWCEVPAAGDHTLKVVNDRGNPTSARLTLVPLGAATEGCFSPVGTRWDTPTASRFARSALQLDCQPFTGVPGENVLLTRNTKVYGGVNAWITDTTGARICPPFAPDGQHEDSCVLPGEGPYRVISQVPTPGRGFPAEYAVKARSLTDPQGCRTAAVRPFGPLTGLDFRVHPCFTFTVDQPRALLVHQVDKNASTPVMVLGPDGERVCWATDPCRLPAEGRYLAVLDEAYLFRDTAEDLLLYDRSSAAGCVPTRTGLYRGELKSAGQYDCLALDVPRGARIAALTPLAVTGVDVEVEAVDATGTAQCSASQLALGDCELTGTAPYRVLVHTEDSAEHALGAYSLALYRTDGPSGCPVLPAGSFADGGAKAAFTTGEDAFAHCFTLPADPRPRTEALQLIATSGGAAARLSVLDGSGESVCDLYAAHGWTACSLAAGQVHTVLVTGREQTASYTLTRRDVTATASSAGCATSAAAKVGGPSLAGTSGGPGTLRCHRITTGAATDVLHLNARDAQGTANLVVFDADGEADCSWRNRSCSVTGSTSYQVLVQTPATLPAAPAYRLDALRIGTASGPAPECVRVPSVAYGYGPITGTLDESRTAVCAVLPTAGFDRFDLDVTDTTGATATAVPALYNTAWNNGCQEYIPTGWQCAAGGNSSLASPSVFLLGLPEKSSRTSYQVRLACRSAVCGPDDTDVTGISPATAVSGTKAKVTITGTALGPATELRIYRDGRTIRSVPDSVAPDHRSVTVTLDLTGVAPGYWNASVYTGCCQHQVNGFTVTEPQLTSTAAPKVTGTAKTGAKVTAAPGTWSAAPTSYTYQWKADGRAIGGAIGKTYTVPASLVGKKLTVTVTAHRSGWRPGAATSPAVTVAKGDAPKATKVPVITGTAKVGRTLKAGKGTWSPAPTSYTYQWYANGRAIGGATKASLVLKSAQKGKKITVKVVAKRTGHKDGSAVSKATKAVVK
ncbi:Tat pathway signal protein [Streptomyces sp. NPDC048290]|uniref:Tat pathway signal protein n=1 Tax=Streptomyces sp. NPDC048290 TaxID=3155811 RepID=UPI003428AFC2